MRFGRSKCIICTCDADQKLEFSVAPVCSCPPHCVALPLSSYMLWPGSCVAQLAAACRHKIQAFPTFGTRQVA